MLDKYASLAQEFSQVQILMKKSAVPSGEDNSGFLFKSHLAVPQEITLDANPALQVTPSCGVHPGRSCHSQTDPDPNHKYGSVLGGSGFTNLIQFLLKRIRNRTLNMDLF